MYKSCYISILWVNACVHITKVSLFYLFVIADKLCSYSRCQWTFISEEIVRYEYKITFYTCTKLWLASRASHKIALADLSAFWVAAGHRASGEHDPCIIEIQINCTNQTELTYLDWLSLHLKFGSVYISQLDGISGYHVNQLQI